MVFESCLDCVRKHVASAATHMNEAYLGYPIHRWYAVGELAHAENECNREHPELSKMIREQYRIPIMNLQPGQQPPSFDTLMVHICLMAEDPWLDGWSQSNNSKQIAIPIQLPVS